MANPEIVALLKLQSTQFVGELRKVRGDFRSMGREAQNLGRLITGIFVTGAIGRYARSVINVGDELSKLNQKTGLSVEILNGLTQAAGLAGVGNDQLSVGIRTLNKNLLDASNGTGEARIELQRFGVDATQAGQLLQQPEEALFKMVRILEQIPEASERGAVAQKLMGRSGAELLPLLNQGSESLRKQIKELHEHRKITTEQAKAAEAFNDSLTSLTTAFQGFLQRGLNPVLPVLTDLIKAFTALMGLDIDGFISRIAAMTGEMNILRGVVAEFLVLNTFLKDMAASVALVSSLIADPANYKEILKTFEEIDKEIREEANRRQSLLFPEATGGKPKDFTTKAHAPGSSIPTLEGSTVTARAVSSELSSLIKLRQEELGLLEIQEKQAAAQEEREAILTASQRHLKAEIALLERNLTIQKEIESAAKDSRDVDPRVAETANVKLKAEMVALAFEEEQIIQAQNKALEFQRGIQQEILGTDAQHTAAMQLRVDLRDAEKRAAQSLHELELARLEPAMQAVHLRGQEILTLRDQVVLLKNQNETLGETVERNREIQLTQARINVLIKEGAEIRTQELLEKQLEPFRQAVRQIQKEIDIGAAMPNTLPETQQLRQIELLERTITLRTEEWRAGLLAAEDYYHQVGVLEAQHFALTDQTQQGFVEGWRQAFKQFTGDVESSFGLGQTLARNFVTNMQTSFSSVIGNMFDHLEKGTLSWRTALETVPAILKRITSELIAMLIVQTIAKALGAPTVPVSGMSTGGGAGGGGFAGLFAGLFGGGGGGASGILGAQGRGAANPALFGPGFATGGSFTVGGPFGRDRTPVNFMASRGEQVTIETPEQQRRRGTGANVNFIVVNNAGAEVSHSEREGPDGRTIEIMIEKKINDSIRRGSVGRNISNTFGLNRRGREG